MRELIAKTQIDKDCPTCKGEGYVLITQPDGWEYYEVCPECKHNKT